MKLNSYKLRRWSVQVRWKQRVCQLCGKRNKLQAHHIFSKSYFPELAYDLNNGVALCGSGNQCHVAFHTKFKKSTRHKCTREDWERFVILYKWVQSIK